MRYFKIVGQRRERNKVEEIFTTGQLKAEGPVEALETFAKIFSSTISRKHVEGVFARGGYLVLKENKS